MTVNSQPISPSTTNTTSSIESIEDRETIHRNVKLIYTRNETEILYSRNFDFELNNLVSKIKFSEKVLLKNGITKSFIDSNYISWEILKEGAISGIITSRIEETDFDNWFLRMILEVSSNNFPEAIDENDHLTNAVSDLFVKTLKYSVDFDQWEFGGKAKFKETVKFFTSRMIPIEACLPAFPCKSSNLEKVSGKLPDKGEELALAGLVKFSQLVKIIYPPGFKLWIVSDGHVFSDCIGVDDDVVDVYGEALKDMYNRIKPEGTSPIEFKSLPDIFSIYKTDFKPSVVKNVELDHYLETQLSEEAELCRKILVQSCDSDCGQLRKDVTTDGHSRVQLYRGFSKFMYEDLSLLDSVKGLSKKQLKKIASRVSFEMIKRNDAYSNLIELVFPYHLRLSIHAHNNAGPKFGIKMLSSEQVKVITSIDDFDTPKNVDLLHIPTPWHNSIIQKSGKYYVVKSKCIKDSIAQGKGEGKWNEDGYFEFTSLKDV